MKNITLTIATALCTVLFLGEGMAQRYQWTKMITADNHAVDPNHKIFEGSDGFYVGVRFFGSIGLGQPPKKKKEKLPTLNAGS